jgi:basic amino acid/polyamine antiporter, APA family
MPATAPAESPLARKLGLFDATMIVMGGVIGSGIFINPYVVARRLHTTEQILGAWILGGLIALAGGFIYAELADRRPLLQGQYAYLRDAYHPSVAFLYGWGLLLVTQTGGMAAVAVTFARYFLNLTGLATADWIVAATTLAILTLINCLGVRAGSNVQSLLMVLKAGAIAGLVFCGFYFPPLAHPAAPASGYEAFSLGNFGAAMTPVLFAYGGWQTASFMAGEMRHPKRDLSRAMVLGVMGVVALYVSVNYIYLRALSPAGLAATTTPASTVMQEWLGARGSQITAAAIAISTLGFLGQGMLTAPRAYFAMAADGLFFPQVAKVSPVTKVPVTAIVLQGIWAIVIAASGRYEQILNYVIPVDFFFIGLTTTSLFRFRARDGSSPSGNPVPGYPFTNIFFVTAAWLIVAATIFHYPRESGIGLLIQAAGLPAFYFWNRQKQNRLS